MSVGLLNQIFVLFGLIIVGYITNKSGILDEVANARLSSLLLKVALPATILNSAFSNENINKSVILNVTLVAIGIYIAIPFISKLIAKAMHLDKTYQLMLNYSNLGFMGFPIISSVYGEKNVIYAAIFMMVFNVHIFTAGVILLQGKTGNMKDMIKKLCSPGIISALLAFVIVILGFSVPTSISSLIGSLGSITTPLAMIVIGSQLAQVDLLKSLMNRQMYFMSFLKLIIYPLAVYIAVKLVTGHGIIAEVSAILIGLPVAGNVTMLCSEYGGDTALAAEGTCISTILSLVSIPIMLAVISK